MALPARSRVGFGSHLAPDHGPPPTRCHRWTGSRPPTCRIIVRFPLTRSQLVVRKPVAHVRGPLDVETLIRSITDRPLSHRCHPLIQNRPAGYSSRSRVRPRFLLPRPFSVPPTLLWSQCRFKWSDAFGADRQVCQFHQNAWQRRDPDQSLPKFPHAGLGRHYQAPQGIRAAAFTT